MRWKASSSTYEMKDNRHGCTWLRLRSWDRNYRADFLPMASEQGRLTSMPAQYGCITIAMSFQANVLKVMIASPGDVAEERTIVTEEIHRWNYANASTRRLVLLPVKWETHSTPQLGSPPQTIINRQLADDADILIGIFGTRIGTPTEDHVSGTVEEIKKHVAAGKTAKVYFSDVPVSPSSINTAQYESVQQFRRECQSTGLYATFSTLEQFRGDVSHHLDLELNQARYLWLETREPLAQEKTEEISRDGMRMLRAAAKSESGMVTSYPVSLGSGIVVVRAGAEGLSDSTARSAARWLKAINELVDRKVIEEAGKDRYRVTDTGYAIATEVNEAEEASKPTEVSLDLVGPSEAQLLKVSSNRVLHLSQLDFLTSTEACMATQALSEEGREVNVVLDHGKAVELFNSPRSDRNPNDLSGPAKLRLAFRVNDHPGQVVLPVMLQPRIVGNTQYITMIGSGSFQLSD
jgi:Domain of unknown function (DUF4062)